MSLSGNRKLTEHVVQGPRATCSVPAIRTASGGWHPAYLVTARMFCMPSLSSDGGGGRSPDRVLRRYRYYSKPSRRHHRHQAHIGKGCRSQSARNRGNPLLPRHFMAKTLMRWPYVWTSPTNTRTGRSGLRGRDLGVHNLFCGFSTTTRWSEGP